jgi:pilus assembly protein CpaB
MAERRYTMVLYGALVVAAVATFGAYRMLGALRDQTRVPTQPVVIATKDLPEGVALDRLELTTRNWPIATVPVGAFSSIDSAVGRVTRIAVFNGEAIVPGRLAPVGAGAGLEQKIAPGTRAMAVRINDVAGISGLLQPNSRVDVLVTLAEDANNRETQMAKLFMENMRVLSVGTEVQRDADGKPNNATTVTLGVTPQQAEQLAVAMNKGSIQLVLRGYGDPDTVRTSGATSKDVLALLRGAPAVTPEAPHREVRRRAAPPKPGPVPVAVAMAKPSTPDSVTVSVYRGEKPTKQTFEKPSTGAVPKTP